MKYRSTNRLLLLANCILFLLVVFTPFSSRNALPQERQRSLSPRASYEGKIDALIASMTVEEKAGQLNLISFGAGWGPTVKDELRDEYKKLIREGKLGAIFNAAGADFIKELQKTAVEESRLKIPLLFGFDIVHGFKTLFPVALAEVSSWDPSLIEASARFQAMEASAVGINWTFAPMLDISRDPRWGRIAEGYGEDPYLGSVMAAAWVRGFQGDLSSPQQILSCAKHFVAYGAAEGGRDYDTVDLSERTLREIYLPPFKAAVDAGVEAVMGSFNEISGIPSCANKQLLNNILRNELKFKGVVVSDWNAIAELVTHGIARTQKEAAMVALNAGVDMDMESRSYVTYIPELIREGKISEKMLNDSVRRVLRAKCKLGLFDDPYRFCNNAVEKNTVMNAQLQDAALEIARRSIVLLKNENNVLPLGREVKNIAVIGPLAHNKKEPLHWHLFGNPNDVVTVVEGIRHKLSGDVTILYAQGCEITDKSKDGFSQAIETAKQADAVILVLGEEALMSGEAHCRSTLDLPGVQNDLAKVIYKTGKPIVVVLMNGRPLAINWIAEHIPAVIEAWFLGIKSGAAIADVLFGDYNPSGKLPVTFPRSAGQIPLYYNHKNTGRPGQLRDPYSSKYIDLPLTPLYPFGHGLSYTKFEYGKLTLSAHKISFTEPLQVSVEVKNVGDRDGEEIVQLYVKDEVGSVTRPIRELKGFKKISLKPGEVKTVEFSLTAKDLAFYNKEMKSVTEPGTFKVSIGTNSVKLQEESFEVVH
ncbi:MAG: glycoside hydrolase family 3 N-terminal domain-containing protein [Pseudomonadota bacterium]